MVDSVGGERTSLVLFELGSVMAFAPGRLGIFKHNE